MRHHGRHVENHRHDTVADILDVERHLRTDENRPLAHGVASEQIDEGVGGEHRAHETRQAPG